MSRKLSLIEMVLEEEKEDGTVISQTFYLLANKIMSVKTRDGKTSDGVNCLSVQINYSIFNKPTYQPKHQSLAFCKGFNSAEEMQKYKDSLSAAVKRLEEAGHMYFKIAGRYDGVKHSAQFTKEKGKLVRDIYFNIAHFEDSYYFDAINK